MWGQLPQGIRLQTPTRHSTQWSGRSKAPETTGQDPSQSGHTGCGSCFDIRKRTSDVNIYAIV